MIRTMLDTVKRTRGRWSSGDLTFFRDFVVLSGGEVVSKTIGFFVFAVLARTLRPEGYGAVEYVVGLSVFFATLVECGLGAVGVRRIAFEPGDLPKLAAQIPVVRLGLALISVPLMVLMAAPAIQGLATRSLVWLFALSLLAVPWRQDWVFQATERMGEATFAQVLRMSVFALVVLALVRNPADILVVGWAEIAAVSAMSLYCVAVQHAKITPYRLRAPANGLSRLAKEGALVGLSNVIWAANQYAPLLFVASLASGEEVAWFGAASRVIGSLLTFSNLYYFILYPAIARVTVTDREELASILAASFRVLAWGGTFVALVLTLLAEPLSILVFGHRFAHSAPMLMTMGWILPITLLSGHARWSLVAAGIQSRVVYAQVAGSVVITILGIPLVFVLGGRGAALASVGGCVAFWVASHAFAARNGRRLPAVTMAAGPAATALAVIGVIHVLGLAHWSAGLGAVVFAAAAPLLDRKLLPGLARLGAVKLASSGCPGPSG